MALVGRVPKVAAHPELVTFRCHNCQHVHTQESEDRI
jgi:hypothetical protein